jgi:hypothetical protein
VSPSASRAVEFKNASAFNALLINSARLDFVKYSMRPLQRAANPARRAAYRKLPSKRLGTIRKQLKKMSAMATDGFAWAALTSDIPELPELSGTQNHQKHILWAQFSALWRRNIAKGDGHQRFYESS